MKNSLRCCCSIGGGGAPDPPPRRLHRTLGTWTLTLIVALCVADVVEADNAFQKALAKAMPSVVTITGETRLVLGPAGSVSRPLVASGVILTEDGYIVSNASSLGRMRNLKVRLKEGESVDARAVKVDRTMDLVILKVERKGLPALSPADDAGPRLGQWVIAIGNPFALSKSKNDPLSASVGVVAAVDPVEATGFGYKGPVIHADLSINIGAFGGALVDLDGRLIGVTGRLLTDARTNTPVNFAIPASAVKKLLDEARKPKAKPPKQPKPKPTPDRTLKKPGYLGAFILDETQSAEGATVFRVVPGAPADAAGLREGDLITAVNGHKVANGRECLKQLDALAPGQTAKVTVRRGRNETEVTVKLERAPSPVLR